MHKIIPLLFVVFLVPIVNLASATVDLNSLPSPDFTIYPTSGPPGTTVAVTVTNLPNISNETYPYPELDLYLPFSGAFGVTVPSHCGGQDCFPVYTHDEVLAHNVSDRIITFSLFSTDNPKPIYLNSFENSVCDVLVNGKTVERFSTLCNTKDIPVGNYQIKLVWTLQSNLQVSRTIKTVNFTVTQSSTSSQNKVADNGDSILKQYANNQINETQFETKLKAIGWNDESIRQAKGVLGKLPHQMGLPFPDQEPIKNTGQQETTQTQESIKMQDDLTLQTKSQIPHPQPTINESPPIPQPDLFPWSSITIGLVGIASISIVLGIIFTKKSRSIAKR